MALEPFREFSGPGFNIESQLDDCRIGQAMETKNLAGAVAALTNVGEAQRRGGDQDVLVTEVDQVTSGEATRLYVVERNRVGGKVVGHAVGDHVRGLRRLDEVAARKFVGAGNDDQPRRTPGEEGLQL